MNLNVKAWLSLSALAVVMGLLLFLPAGTIRYWQAWLYLSVFAGATLLLTLYLVRRDPALLERRMEGGGHGAVRGRCGIRCTRAGCCISEAPRWRSAHTGGCSRSR